jgi:hypothetical protein
MYVCMCARVIYCSYRTGTYAKKSLFGEALLPNPPADNRVNKSFDQEWKMGHSHLNNFGKIK